MAAAATPAQGNGGPSTPPVNGRYRTGDDIDPMKDERSGLIREVGCQAIWSLSSCKPGFGVDQLRDQSLENYWQSDGQLPHLVNIQFRRKMTIRDICIYTDFKLDESYTPSKISIRCGTHFNDLQEVELVEFSEPSGWVQIYLKDIRDRPIRTFMLQLAVLSNHQNGRDTHLRQIRIHSPVDNLPVAVFPDVSIWLHQLVKGFRDKDGNPLPNAHLLGVFHRICKLLNYGIKPVFVFDGGVPILKQQTLAARRQRKVASLDKAELYRQKILSAYLQQQLQRQTKQALPPSLRMRAKISALSGSSQKSPSVSPTKSKLQAGNNERDEVDEDLESFRAALVTKLEADVDQVDRVHTMSDSDEDDDAEAQYRYGVDYSENFSMIQSKDFDNLPLETQHEILFEMQESRKMNSWGKFDSMPKDLQTFSNYQMDRLVKRRTLQKKIQSVQQEMGQRHIHVQNLDDLLKMDYNFENKDAEISGSRDEGYLLVKFQKQKEEKGEEDSKEPKPGTSATSVSKPEVITIDDYIEDASDDDEGGVANDRKQCTQLYSHNSTEQNSQQNKRSRASEDEEEDLKLAIQLSLMESQADPSSSSSREVGSDTLPKSGNQPGEILTKNINVVSSQESYTSIKVDAEPQTRPAMEEPLQSNPLKSMESSQLSRCAKFLDTVGFPMSATMATLNVQEMKVDENNKQLNQSTAVVGRGSTSQSEDDDDDDFEEVEIPSANPLCTQTLSSLTTSQCETVATIDLNVVRNQEIDNDIFADIFSNVENSNKNAATLPIDMQIQPSDKNIDNEHEGETPNIVVEGEPQSQVHGATDNNWDSDSEFEQDLLDMVVESTVNLEPSTSTKLANKGDKNSSSHPLASSAASKEAQDNKPGSSKRMITAEYMQAQDQLNSKLDKLQAERGFQERVATSISDQMQIETQELIALFGIPYVVSPTEAESQCAFLDRACLTDGTITDDSDVWLFGGQRVYKQFFSQSRHHVEFYQAADIQRVLNLDREKLIVMAMMIGSDYSDGIQGVGPVLALEILSEFSSTEMDSFEILVTFQEWWEEIQSKPLNIFSGSKIKEKLRKLKIRPGFPNKTVYDAFINPTIDTSTEAFKWGNPDLDAIRSYTKSKFGWDQSKCDSMLMPVIKNFRCEAEQSRQLTLDSYILLGKVPELEKGAKRKKGGSKRMQNAMKKLRRVGATSEELNLSAESSSEDESGKQTKSSTNNNTKKSVPKLEPVRKLPDKESPNKPSTSTTKTANDVSSKPKLEIIPQRIQEESNKMKNKQKAIEIFKNKGKTKK